MLELLKSLEFAEFMAPAWMPAILGRVTGLCEDYNSFLGLEKKPPPKGGVVGEGRCRGGP
ncbi:AcrZ family multidrug efflux pump-associated protein [Escherichia coli]|nr:AcrZ family multidrug efflux pump-associated protein [Escherichia coli]